MSADLLTDFMYLVLDVTGAERGMAIDADMSVCAAANLEASEIESKKFNDLAVRTLHDAMSRNEAIITNNIITDPSEAPTTNTNFADLRVVVTIPLPNHGAVYVDQHIRNGVIARESIDRLHRLGNQLAERENGEPPANLRDLYDQMPDADDGDDA